MTGTALDDVEPRPPIDDVGFNDPGAWGYCERCAFDVGIRDGVRIEHRYTRNGHATAICVGSGKPVVVEESPAHATALIQISLIKDPSRARSRAHNQRRRWYSRDRARWEDDADEDHDD